ncbi:2TM domain-containing protein [Chryseobacterium taklimakanense]|uniref:2TM domain-containing protein n=1 Tax=Chryseobacterium taklimakanense TaxID=536441 RepID=UPI001EF5A193|nr:2TM domain-containing protein [Chryseobacterium taklimakanense]MCG7279751.1 2TM domain-containing protein [Chryseobacterium taklimakanense]
MENNIKYEQAKKRVKQIKGFYIHAGVFILVNVFLVFLKFMKHGQIDFNVWGTSLWGVGLAAHGASVFLPDFFLGRNWEERKIRELMDKQKNLKP